MAISTIGFFGGTSVEGALFDPETDGVSACSCSADDFDDLGEVG
jgi:hypothetical protein